MNLQVDTPELLSVELGPGRTGISSVLGYTILNDDGTVKEVRSSTGIYEISSGSGAYAVKRTFASSSYPSDWIGHVKWDTGEADASMLTVIFQKISFRRVSVGVVVGGDSGGGAGGGGGTITYIHD